MLTTNTQPYADAFFEYFGNIDNNRTLKDIVFFNKLLNLLRKLWHQPNLVKIFFAHRLVIF